MFWGELEPSNKQSLFVLDESCYGPGPAPPRTLQRVHRQLHDWARAASVVHGHLVQVVAFRIFEMKRTIRTNLMLNEHPNIRYIRFSTSNYQCSFLLSLTGEFLVSVSSEPDVESDATLCDLRD